MKYTVPLLTLLMWLCVNGVAQAQNLQAIPALPDAPAAPDFAHGNKALGDVLDLQYQIQTLKLLVAHEAAVNDMARAGKQIGVNTPTLPHPTRSLCALVPANIPCANAYGDLYDGYSALPIATTHTPIAPVAHIAVENEAPVVNDSPIAAAAPTFYWFDIACAHDVCSALVAPDANDVSKRVRLRVGQSIDNATIANISVSGVTATMDGKAVRFLPAPRG